LRQQKDQPKAAWGYFLSFLFLMIVAVTVPLLFGLPGVAREVAAKLKEAPDFQATLKNGALAVTGVAQPAVFKGDDSFVVALDTTATSTVVLDSFLEQAGQSGILLAADRIELVDGSTGQHKIQYWKNVPDYSLNKAAVVGAAEKYLGPGWLAVFALLFFVVVLLGSVLAQIVLVFSVALIVFVIAKVRRQTWRFKELFTVGLFAITLPTIIAAIFTLLGIGTPLVQFLALLAFMLAVVFTKEEKEIGIE